MAEPIRLVGAVDIGGTKIAVGLVDEDGKVVARSNFPTLSVAGWKAGVSDIREALKQCQEVAGRQIDILGVGCTGPVDPVSGVVGNVALLRGWEGCNLIEALGEMNVLEVAVENDADAAALAEHMWGAGRGVKRFLYVTVSTGIGTGCFVCDGKLYRGARGSHPEMGHHSIDPHGPSCYCRARGCWESLASGTAIARDYLDRRAKTIPLHNEPSDARTVFQLAKADDEVAKGTVEHFIRYLGVGLGNVTNILVPEVIALGGGVMQSVSPYLGVLQERIRATCHEVLTGKTIICLAELQADVGLVGAGAVGFVRRVERNAIHLSFQL